MTEEKEAVFCKDCEHIRRSKEDNIVYCALLLDYILGDRFKFLKCEYKNQDGKCVDFKPGVADQYHKIFDAGAISKDEIRSMEGSDMTKAEKFKIKLQHAMEDKAKAELKIKELSEETLFRSNGIGTFAIYENGDLSHIAWDGGVRTISPEVALNLAKWIIEIWGDDNAEDE